MKLVEIRTHLLSAPVSRPFAYSRVWVERREALLVEVRTDSGLTGWGEAFGPARLALAAVELLRPLYLGFDPLAHAALWHRGYTAFREHGRKGPLVDALSALDIALWDIKGKHFGAPIHQLLGGPIRSSVTAYASGLFRLRDGDPERDLAREAAEYVARGFPAVKMKVGFGAESDRRAVKAVRAAIGAGTGLMVDGNEAFDAPGAIAFGRAIEDENIAWFEEPVPPEDLEGYRRVRAALAMPIAGGEAEFTRYGFRDVLAAQAMDIVQPDICAAGGFTECTRIADLAQAFGVRCIPHVWGTAIAIAASLQWLAVIPPLQMSMCAEEPMFEYDCTEHPIRDALLTPALRPTEGVIAVPTGPGLGIDIDPDLLKVFRIG